MPDSHITQFPNIWKLIQSITKQWEEHEGFIKKSLYEREPAELEALDILAGRIVTLAGAELSEFVESYRWLCRVFNEEQVFFFREQRYRHSNFAEVEREVYSDPSFMRKYMQGLLVSQLVWANHANSFLFHRRFISSLSDTFSYLEVGPGHGLYMATALALEGCRDAEGWDISPESLVQTQNSLDRMEIDKPFRLIQRDVMSAEAGSATFDIIVISEVLEHLEDPSQALKMLRGYLSPKGRIFINIPINSPAPDHIYLLESTDSVTSLITQAGYAVESFEAYPATGYSLQRAEKTLATISCLAVATAAHSA